MRGIRRGWYLGGEGFRGGLVKRLKAAVGGSQASSYAGQAKREHGQAQAERLLTRGLRVLGLTRRQLERTPKGQAEKAVLAWWLRRQTTVGRGWVAERLRMGDASRVSKAIQRVNLGDDKTLGRLKNRLAQSTAQERSLYFTL